MNPGMLEIRPTRLFMALSDALDLASPDLAQHQLGTAFIAWSLCIETKMTAAVTDTVFIAALLHDIGALSPEEKIRLVKNKPIVDIEGHCIAGEKVLKRLPLLAEGASLVRYHHRPWAAWELAMPTPQAFQSQILHLADTVERTIDRSRFILDQAPEILARIRGMAGIVFLADLVEAFSAVAATEGFWLNLVSRRLYDLLMHYGPGDSIPMDNGFLLGVSQMVRDIIDFRSPFTATHSTGVSRSAGLIGGLMGCPAEEVCLLEIAGNLHDLGKMAVPNSILHKPGALSSEEYRCMKQHTYHTYSVLMRAGFSKEVAEWAGFHHENLQGSGYPFHKPAASISRPARMVAVADVLTALLETRPYRKGLPPKEVVRLLKTMGRAKLLDGEVVDRVAAAYDDIAGPTRDAQQAAREYYLSEFTGLAPTDAPI